MWYVEMIRLDQILCHYATSKYPDEIQTCIRKRKSLVQKIKTPLYHWLQSIRHMHVRPFGISLLQNLLRSSNAKVTSQSKGEKEKKANSSTYLVLEAPMVSSKLLACFLPLVQQ